MPKILIVDDSQMICHLIGELLKHNGYEVAVANRAMEAIRILESQPIDLALLDISMPEIDGLRLLQMIRNKPKYGALPVIMLTASHEPDNIIRSRKMGVLDYILKDNGLTDQLIQRIRHRLPTPAAA